MGRRYNPIDAHGQVRRTTFERSFTGPSGPSRAGVLTISPICSPDFGVQLFNGDTSLTRVLKSVAPRLLQVEPDLSHSHVAAYQVPPILANTQTLLSTDAPLPLKSPEGH